MLQAISQAAVESDFILHLYATYSFSTFTSECSVKQNNDKSAENKAWPRRWTLKHTVRELRAASVQVNDLVPVRENCCQWSSVPNYACPVNTTPVHAAVSACVSSSSSCGERDQYVPVKALHHTAVHSNTSDTWRKPTRTCQTQPESATQQSKWGLSLGPFICRFF